MAEDLRQRHALVTGGGRGIGLAIARSLTAAGARVTVLGRDRGALEAALSDGSAAGYAMADVTNSAEIADALAEAQADRGPVEILVANAGAASSAPFLKTAPEDFRQMMEVNLLGIVHLVQPVLPGMIERGFGRIVVVASTAAVKGYGYVSAYCAAKHAALGLVRSLAIETARTGVTVNAVCPGYTDTDIVAASIERIIAKTGRTRDQALQEIVKGNPQGRLVRPEEVGNAALWLCGDGAGAVTGQAIAVAGGEI